MNDAHAGYERLVDAFKHMAQSHKDICAAAIIGSRARTDHPADEWSDLDIVLFVSNVDTFVQEVAWYEALGEVWLSFITRTPTGDPERRVLYAGGLDVDFAINPLSRLQDMSQHTLAPEAVDLLQRGIWILVDKDGLLEALQQKPLPKERQFLKPDASSFTNLVHDFWFHTLWTAKHLRRGELWWAKTGCDMHLKGLLIELLHWHTHAHHDASYDTWIGARFIEEWADPRAVADFREIFAHYDEQDIAHALYETMNLFRWSAIETAKRWNYPYPDAEEKAITELVKQILSEV